MSEEDLTAKIEALEQRVAVLERILKLRDYPERPYDPYHPYIPYEPAIKPRERQCKCQCDCCNPTRPWTPYYYNTTY